MTVQEKARELANMIKASEEFQTYLTTKEKAGENQDVADMLNDFQEKQIELQKKQMVGEDTGGEFMQQVQDLYQILMRDPAAAEYMQAQIRFSLMVNDVYQILGEAMQG
ncbi:MAG: YlbF family regulator [Clostridiales Family XIII bacterium]|jgi:cell fate (sporulation/competence/biofilm development) regulator YlbF (YheA/YmcA/DUF963 family)|nr:YlbF family regulator [Clostridiales Family XIII bacterium]